jgi:hypothetical protein
LVRKHPTKPAKWILTIVFKGRGTHHAIEKGEDGNLAINGKTYGEPAATLENLVTELKRKPKGWPVLLTKIVKADGSTMAVDEWTESSSSGGTSAPTSRDAGSSKAVGGGTGMTAKAGTSGPKWIHGSISKADAEALISKKTGGAFTAGTFLFRKRAGKPGYVPGFRQSRPRTHRPTDTPISTGAPLLIFSSTRSLEPPPPRLRGARPVSNSVLPISVRILLPTELKCGENSHHRDHSVASPP